MGIDVIDFGKCESVSVLPELSNKLYTESVYTRWAPTSYKWSYNPYKGPYKLVNGVITLLITGRGPPCKIV